MALSVSCSDFLEPKSQSEYIPKEVTALNEMLLGNAYPTPTSGNILSLLPLLDDDIMCSDVDAEVDLTNSIHADDFEWLKAFFSWQPDAFVVAEAVGNKSASWETYYDLVMGANAALDYIDEVSGTDDEKNNVKAQALTLRGFYYFQLVNLWGAPYTVDKKAAGVPLKLTSALGTSNLPRNTVEEVYEQVLDDLLEAERLYLALPVEEQFRRNGRTSLPMTQLLLSRVYLYMENWTEAAKYAQKVIDNTNFSLVDLNSSEGKYYNFATQDSPETIWVFGSVTSWVRELNLTMTREEIDPTWGDKYTYTFYFLSASDDLVKHYVDNDLRKTKYLVEEIYMEESYLATPSGAYWPFAKFDIYMNTDWSGNETTPAYDQSKWSHSLRLSEAYLNLAEAAVQNGDDKTALSALNDLRAKRFANYTELSGLTGDALLGKVRDERRLELCFEGHRWFDLRRYGMPSVTHDWKVNGETFRYTLEEKDPSYTLPVPEYIMEKNRALTQNPLAGKREGVEKATGNN